MTPKRESDKDICEKCGVDTEGDGRTLWMACFYDMSEMDVPFTLCALNGTFMEKEGMRRGLVKYVPIWKKVFGSEQVRPFYTLRVCKSCRGSWMESIREWWHKRPETEESCGSGIYVRDLGRNIEVTREEFERRKACGK
jgi:hypothetical protein